MAGPRDSVLLPDAPRSRLLGIVVALASIAAITAVIYPLRQITPAVSTGVLYLLAVLLVSTFWGLWLGLLTAVVSAGAFNFFHIPPTGRFTIIESENWVALGVFLVAAVVAGSVAELARTRAAEADARRREADLAAEMARLLLGETSVAEALPAASQRLAEALDLPSAEIVLGEAPDDERRMALPLRVGERSVGSVLLPAGVASSVRERLVQRVVPSLEALLAAAIEREALEAEVVETRALRRSDVIKTALLRAVSHDLRSPITAIVTAGEALDSPSLTPEEHRELASAVRGEGERLARLVDKLLDLSRLQSGAAEPRRDWTSVEEIIRGVVEEMGQPERFNLSIDRDLPLIRADAGQLDRAIANLLENAVRYSGGAPVSVRARAVGNRLLVRIVDRGPGIPRRELERVFEPFYRGEGPRGPRHTGSGLGLAIVRGFVEANGGRVWAESLPGQGTSMVVELPLEADPAAAGAPAHTGGA